MDKGTIAALKLAGYSVRKTRGNYAEPTYEWFLNADSDWEFEAESDYFHDTEKAAWESALHHIQTGENR